MWDILSSPPKPRKTIEEIMMEQLAEEIRKEIDDEFLTKVMQPYYANRQVRNSTQNSK